MSLSAFIDDHHEEIIREFAVFAKTLMPPGAGMSDADLPDHAEEILTAIGVDMGTAQTADEQSKKSRGWARRGRWRPPVFCMRTIASGTVSSSARYSRNFEPCARRDELKFKTSIRQNQLPNITSFYYLRAHGRNFKKWWHHEHKDERYDYLYKPADIQEFGETLKAVKKIVRKSYGYMNNHGDAKAVANAIELKHFLGERVPEDLNPEMLKRYPELKAIVREKARQDLLTPVRKA